MSLKDVIEFTSNKQYTDLVDEKLYIKVANILIKNFLFATNFQKKLK